MYFKDVLNGVYTVEISNGKDRTYHFKQHYAYVKETDNNLSIDMN
ncbi:Protein of unknown function [Bacillus cytotoxicus]|uniref:Uncharacterized protein n=1 Tax=Bacillus cytotoxicus TaxID=580165 RepID=A0AAX2CKR2_9BACI|nr:Protein of unknown function [Bacillus cytotoxicus]SCN41293.1 Protein of unknown function [Bacillus cytotoxicus]